MQNPKQSWYEFDCSQFRKGKVIARSIRTDRYRFTLWEKPNELVGTELYDYKNDPQGNVNLAALPENKKLVKQMTRLHREMWPRM